MSTDNTTSAFSFIPNRIFQWLEKARKSNSTDNEFVIAMRGTESDQILAKINEIFESACANTGLKPDDLLSQIDFRENDIACGAFSSLLAVPRAINSLYHLGFRKIVPIKAPKNKKSADLKASYGDRLFAIEVFHRATWSESLRPADDGPLASVTIDRERLHSFFQNGIKGKFEQVEETRTRLKCELGLIVLVLDSEGWNALSTNDDVVNCLRSTYEVLKGHQGLYCGLFPDRCDPAIFPQLPEYVQE